MMAGCKVVVCNKFRTLIFNHAAEKGLLSAGAFKFLFMVHHCPRLIP
jgi:hypothetical protein